MSYAYVLLECPTHMSYSQAIPALSYGALRERITCLSPPGTSIRTLQYQPARSIILVLQYQ
eukprot:1949249-Rhodomonas_salina.5